MLTSVQKKLYSLQDKKYGDFQSKLLPTLDKKSIIGVRTNDIKNFAKEIYKSSDKEKFLTELPHKFFDENQLHIFILSQEKDFDLCIKQVNKFLPYIDNWATCDQLSPICFKKNKIELLTHINKWLKSKKTYTVRFAIEMLMSHFLDDDFDEKYLDAVAKIDKIHFKDDYYVKMMIAWYFATALAKQYKSTFPYIKKYKLEEWTHNKTIQKAVESYRITDEQKRVLKSLKIK